MPDCFQFALGSRARQICDGESELSLDRTNKFRSLHGIESLAGEDTPFPLAESGNGAITRMRAKTSSRRSGGCCGGNKSAPEIVTVPVDGTGVGGRLIEMFKAHGFEACDDCYVLANRMNEWGVDGCRSHLGEIVADIMPRALAWEAEKVGWWAKLLPTTVTAAAVQMIVEQAIATAQPLQMTTEPQSNPALSVARKKKPGPANRYVNRPESLSAAKKPPLVGSVIDRSKLVSHMIYHVMPLAGTTEWVWRRHMRWIREVRPKFNGRLLIGIVTPGDDDHWSYFPPSAVMDELSGTEAEFFTSPNHVTGRSERGGIGEGVLFPKLLQQLDTDDANQTAFYGHCKGVTRRQEPHDGPPHLWAEAMFTTLFRNHDEAVGLLDTKGICGPFLMRGQFPRGLPGIGPDWFYSGTFFAMRLADVFRRPNWKRLPHNYGCVEQWPRLNFELDTQAGCLFMNGVNNLYDVNYWKNKITPAFTEWKESHGSSRTN